MTEQVDHSSVSSVVKVLWKETALPHCRETDSRWNRYVASLVSSVTAVIRRPNSLTQLMTRHMSVKKRIAGTENSYMTK